MRKKDSSIVVAKMADVPDIANRRARLDAAAAALFASSVRRLIACGKLRIVEGLIITDDQNAGEDNQTP